MTKEYTSPLADLRYIRLFPRRYRTPRGKGNDYWTAEIRRYGNAEKRIESSDWHWYVIGFKDGRKELAYLRVLQNGFFSGLHPAIYRGIIIPRRITIGTFAHVEEIELAF